MVLYENNFYDGEKGDWEGLAGMYGCKEEFMEFIDYIVNKTGYIPYSD